MRGMRVVELNLAELEEGYARLRVRDRRAEARLFVSVEAHGQSSPIWVVARAEGRYLVIDGHKRGRALCGARGCSAKQER